MPPPAIPPRATKPAVQDSMNAAIGRAYWVGQSYRWQNLLAARNEFVRLQLRLSELTLQRLKEMPQTRQRYYKDRFETAFKTEFFQYSRDHRWMEDAVGSHDAWIFVEGMAKWHLRMALLSIERDNVNVRPEQSAEEAQVNGPPEQGPEIAPGDQPRETGSSSYELPFDPVRDSIQKPVAEDTSEVSTMSAELEEVARNGEEILTQLTRASSARNDEKVMSPGDKAIQGEKEYITAAIINVKENMTMVFDGWTCDMSDGAGNRVEQLSGPAEREVFAGYRLYIVHATILFKKSSR